MHFLLSTDPSGRQTRVSKSVSQGKRKEARLEVLNFKSQGRHK
jgi:hypothetical protein